MKKIITFLYLLILAYACYDDKGNYDYREINQISIQNIDSLVLCDQMDLLSIPVTLEERSIRIQTGLLICGKSTRRLWRRRKI